LRLAMKNPRSLRRFSLTRLAHLLGVGNNTQNIVRWADADGTWIAVGNGSAS